MAEPVRARRLTDQEGRRLQQIVRRGKHRSVRVRRAMIIMASASGTLVPAIARLVAADEDTVRDVIHLFSQGPGRAGPSVGGGRPRRISDEDVDLIVVAATTRPEKLGLPFTHWSLRKLAAYPGSRPGWRPWGGSGCGRSCIHAGSASSAPGPGRNPQVRTGTPSWTGSSMSPCTSRTAASGLTSSGRCRSGPVTAAPGPGANGPPAARDLPPDPWHPLLPRLLLRGRRPAAGASPGGARALITPWPRSSRSARPGPAATACSSILDNLSANKTPVHPALGRTRQRRAVLHSCERVVGQPDPQFGPVRAFVMGGSDHPNHTVLARRLQDYLRWRNANARHPDVLAAQRRERARIRSERQQRWGRPKPRSQVA